MIPTVLTIAGSDCSGGAGIQADIKTISALGGYAASVITAVTAQNTLEVQAVYPQSAEAVAAQLHSVFDDLRPSALKIGMLPHTGIVSTVASALRRHSGVPVVCDPVMISTSGRRLMAEDAVQILTTQLFPLCTLITPNLHEAAFLDALIENNSDTTAASTKVMAAIHPAKTEKISIEGHDVCSASEDKGGVNGTGKTEDNRSSSEARKEYSEYDSEEKEEKGMSEAEILKEMEETARRLAHRFQTSVLVKGGHLAGEDMCDVLYDLPHDRLTRYTSRKIHSRNLHGTGCTLSSAIATFLANGCSLHESVAQAKTYMDRAIERGKELHIGQGNGPLWHF